jgi:glycosyltransferase involved in cell wall biosynthesis
MSCQSINESVTRNQALLAALAGPAPAMSILTPCFRYDPSALTQALARQEGVASGAIEFILLDDGSQDPRLTATLQSAVLSLPFPAAFIDRRENAGRAGARNRLTSFARARHWLMLDADMIPDRTDFVARWLKEIEDNDPGVSFGGFSVEQAHADRETALHKFLAQRSDCHPAAARALHPALSLATSNLLVRSDVLERAAFDEEFSGWGWEDVEWAIRVSAFTQVRHIDNSATHAGLDRTETLLRKFNEAGPNYRRLCQRHPDVAQSFPSHKAARVLRAIPGQKLLRPVWAAVARLKSAPMIARHAGLKLYRTSIYAEHLP